MNLQFSLRNGWRPLDDPERLAEEESLDIRIGEISVGIADGWTSLDRAALLGPSGRAADLADARDACRAECPSAVRDLDLSGEFTDEIIAALIDALEANYRFLPATMRRSYDQALQDIDGAAMRAAAAHLLGSME